jgi:CubicO group peptidase (beta-lactamase class C family)
MKMLRAFAVSLLAPVLLITYSCRPRTADVTGQKIDSIVNFYSADKPGGQLAVSLNGRMIYSKAWGLADLENKVPLTTETLIEAGSVSKQFTAAAILLLQKQGKLSLDDDVSQYIPALPSYGQPILIRQLIHHTSGLHEWSDIAELAGWPFSLNVPDNHAVLDMICRQKSLNNPPGTIFRYSNSNYVLLALIAEKASGQTFADFTKQHIFGPAGMTHTRWRNDVGEVVPMRSQAYEVKNEKFRSLMPGHAVHGPGGLLTTAEDLLKWNEFYLSAKLGGKVLLAKQTGLDTLRNGLLNNYGAGLFVENNAKYIFHHGGATAGYRAKLVCSPELRLSVAWLSNTSMLDTTGRDPAMEVFQMLAGPADVHARPEKHKTVRTSPENLGRFAGLYRSGHSGRDVEITSGPEGLSLSGTPLKALGHSRFKFHEIVLSFDGHGELVVTPPSSEPMLYHLTDIPAVTGLQVYIGKYFSHEVNAWLEVKNANGKLTAHLVSGPAYPMENYLTDGFLVPDLKADIIFKRDQDKKVKALEISTQRSLRIVFKRVNNPE